MSKKEKMIYYSMPSLSNIPLCDSFGDHRATSLFVLYNVANMSSWTSRICLTLMPLRPPSRWKGLSANFDMANAFRSRRLRSGVAMGCRAAVISPSVYPKAFWCSANSFPEGPAKLLHLTISMMHWVSHWSCETFRACRRLKKYVESPTKKAVAPTVLNCLRASKISGSPGLYGAINNINTKKTQTNIQNIRVFIPHNIVPRGAYA